MLDGAFRAANGSGDSALALAKIAADGINVHYGTKQALDTVSVKIPANAVTAFIGPSGCGKSTFLRCINRMNDTIANCRVSGQLTIDGHDIYGAEVDPV
jgi:phosphate transport system ATP-binding protein